MRLMYWLILVLFLVCVCAVRPAAVNGEPLRVITINVWSGLDYQGALKMGEYEAAERQEARFRSLVAQLKELSPDVIFVQEANPVARYAAKLASVLSMDEIHQVVNAGLRIGPVGIPTNLREGLAILAKPGFSLRKAAAWKLSGPPGIHTDILSFHLGEVVLALAGKVSAGGQEVNLVNVHLAASPKKPVDMRRFQSDLLLKGMIDEDSFNQALLTWDKREKRRAREVQNLLGRLDSLPRDALSVAAGDFNAEPDAREIAMFRDQGGFVDVLASKAGTGAAHDDLPTWDVKRNENTVFSARPSNARGRVREGLDYVAAAAGNQSRRLDYVFLRKGSPGERSISSDVVLMDKVGGVQASDHFGVMADIEIR